MEILKDIFLFAEWISENRLIQCADKSWLKTGTGEYDVVAKNTYALYNLFIKERRND